MNQKNTIRILLINSKNQLLLMRVVDPTTTALNKKPRAAFWCTIGGKIEAGETVEQATLRELFEETGLTANDVKLGPIVWHGVHEMIISGKHIELNEKFIVAHTTTNKQVLQDNFTENEKSVVTNLEWLSLSEIISHSEEIFPAVLQTHLAHILAKKYPPEPEWVDLSLPPK
jgi:8-oxo-dGTP pyrophosphatase MutT (NUDIX family)